MNERMLALYRQAFVPHTTVCPDNNMPYETVLFSTEKFAELIVGECLEACSRANEIRHLVPPTQEQVVLSCMREIETTFRS
jgi:hypothetical protein